VAAIEAWRAGGWMGLHQALSLKPWEFSPLDVRDQPPPDDRRASRASWPRVAALRRQLIELGGRPPQRYR
jgi:hypothetical protein